MAVCDGTIFPATDTHFVCTGGGDQGNGQVWAYDPVARRSPCWWNRPAGRVLDNPDNITVGPDGAHYMCEDGGGEQFVVGVDDDGNLFKFAATIY
ncbi:MAG: DUF839 domain-containing protein [Candidatus Manganitrophus sp.]|nr:DUF839 domain-containing protein [Candidatus Manganitrophus sp.]WDT72040.1 MAG: DUF839 domain-containing protein [Candidatus Manganitrophus sp.]WDT80555.1 MAG: DUF839 domain-containing protein [Candidatus Manganitrophus sp.]